MTSEAVLATELHIQHDLSRADQRNARVVKDLHAAGALASHLLLYDQIVIPTKDFGILPALESWLGPEAFYAALRGGVFRFAHLQSMLGYVGNGGGIVPLQIGPGDRTFLPHQQALWGTAGEAIEIQLSAPQFRLARRQVRDMVDVISRLTVEIDSNALDYDRAVAHETYVDIDKDERLRAYVLDATGRRGQSIDLKRIPGVGPATVVLASREPAKTPVELLLRIAESNEALLMAVECGNCALSAPRETDYLLRSKLRRTGIQSSAVDAFAGILDLEAVPDVRASVASGSVDVASVWAIRETKQSRAFRAWLRKAGTSDAGELRRAYVEALRGPSWVGNAAVKAVRFVLTSMASALPLGLGTAVGAIDSFFVEKWLGGYAPQVHVDDLRRLLR